jgi:hypothetical protein
MDTVLESPESWLLFSVTKFAVRIDVKQPSSGISRGDTRWDKEEDGTVEDCVRAEAGRWKGLSADAYDVVGRVSEDPKAHLAYRLTALRAHHP